MRHWLSDLTDAIPFERRQPPPTTPGVGAGGLGVAALLLGAGLMYFFDPEAGARRRAAIGASLTALAHRLGMALDDASRGMADRARDMGVVRRSMAAESQSP
jgi:hypothetical protein